MNKDQRDRRLKEIIGELRDDLISRHGLNMVSAKLFNEAIDLFNPRHGGNKND